MLGILFLSYFIVSGVYIVHRFFKQHFLEQVWLGACLGFLMAMVLPAIWAFAFKFGYLSHIVACLSLVPLNVVAYLKGNNKDWCWQSVYDDKWVLLFLILPFTIFMTYLQYTHNIHLATDGSLHSGQSTYGDLPLHLSIITSAKNASFPLDYAIFPSARLCYPFLIDTFSTSLYLLGLDLASSIVLPSSLICGLIFLGYYLLAKKISNKTVAVLSFLFLFVNGGLGFIYTFDKAGGDIGAKIAEILNGFYKTPTNQPEPYNLRWSNVMADMLLPQRTFMGGWLILFPALFLMIQPIMEDRIWQKKELVLLIIFAGFLPLINTHAFLALGLFSIAQMTYWAINTRKNIKKVYMLQFIIFGFFTLLIAMPQLIGFTFQQAVGSERFLQWHFNWVNNQNGLIDLYPWFYLKNIGLIILPIVITCFTAEKKQHSIILSAFSIFVVAEFIIFQPNHYDNNKLFYVWFALCLPVACTFLMDIYCAIKNIQGAKVLAVLFIVVSLTSGVLTLAREAVSDYVLFDKESVEASDFISQHIPPHSMFLSGTEHINPVSSLSGQNIVCGPDLWLFYHGLNTNERKDDIRHFFEDKRLDVLQKYNVDYIYVSSYEKSAYDIDDEFLKENFKQIFSNDKVDIYKVK